VSAEDLDEPGDQPEELDPRWSPAAGRQEIEAKLTAIGRGATAGVDLGEAALLLAALDRPRVKLDRYRAHLVETGQAVGALGALGLDEAAVALAEVLAGKLGYRGDEQTYDDLQNANLMRVIDRRRGLPVALAILYLDAARRQGWSASALRFPGHVLIRLEVAGRRTILDPYHAGIRLEPAELRQLAKAIGGEAAELTPDHTLPLTDLEVLLRLQNNIKVRRLQQRQTEGGLAALETMLLLQPGDWSLWLEAAELHQQLENLGAAAVALGHAVDLAPSATQRADVERRLASLRRRLN
jgi:regulator of sirC expression with transglutaminase-like and TPR domain